MAIHHALPGELTDIRPLGQATTTVRTSTLYETQHLEASRLILLSGKVMPEHEVVGNLRFNAWKADSNSPPGARAA